MNNGIQSFEGDEKNIMIFLLFSSLPLWHWWDMKQHLRANDEVVKRSFLLFFLTTIICMQKDRGTINNGIQSQWWRWWKKCNDFFSIWHDIKHEWKIFWHLEPMLYELMMKLYTCTQMQIFYELALRANDESNDIYFMLYFWITWLQMTLNNRKQEWKQNEIFFLYITWLNNEWNM